MSHPRDPDLSAVRASYDTVAESYAAQFAAELRHKPLDRALLDCFVELVGGSPGPVADLGCGPGQIARYLHDRGLPAYGVDLSPGMVAVARRLHPAVTFQEGTMLALDAGDGECSGITAFYSVIHLPAEMRPRAFREFHRVLRPDGRLLLSFHIGAETLHADDWLDHPVDLDFQLLDPAQVTTELEAADFTVEARVERRPYEPVEHPTRRGYLLARKRVEFER